VHHGSAALHIADEEDDGEFALSREQLASAHDPHGTIQKLIEQRQEPSPRPRVGRPYHIWRDNLELARMLNDRLASGASD
jgi:hypothetical protein